MKRLSFLLALFGVGAVIVIVASLGAGPVWEATVSVGWGGFAALLLWQGLLFVVLGAAWRATLPGVPFAVLLRGRMARDAATTCLPFSPVGGYAIGARALALDGVAWPVAAAGTVVDVTAEIAAQLVFSLFGVAVLLLVRPGSGLAWPALATVGAAGLGLCGAVWQRRRIGRGLRGLGMRLLGDWFGTQDGPLGGIGRLQDALGRLFVLPRVALGSSVHLVGWVLTGVGTWLSLRLLGAEVDVMHVVALEALLDALVAAAFVVPGAAGVQEAGYIGLGALFGVPPELALGASLLRRGRDLAWGVPILLAWQWREVRRLRAG